MAMQTVRQWLRRLRMRLEGAENRIRELLEAAEDARRKAYEAVVNGHTQRLLDERAALRAEQYRVFTVINFNEAPLTMDGILKRFSMPAAGARHLNPGLKRVRLWWRNTCYHGVAQTLREPLLFERPTEVLEYDGRRRDTDNPFTVQEARAVAPIDIAHSIATAFSPLFWSRKARRPTNFRNYREMYGVLVFEGDLETLRGLQGTARKHLQMPVILNGKTTTVGYSLWNALKHALGKMGQPDETQRTIDAINLDYSSSLAKAAPAGGFAGTGDREVR